MEDGTHYGVIPGAPLKRTLRRVELFEQHAYFPGERAGARLKRHGGRWDPRR